ncbi:MAG: bifunctional UDP-N-acetylglucosamine diphosphorylase/glucosamine-1-phosphate N-acetyltransferase GlmU [bacterium]
MEFSIILLAAGKGTRMKSSVIKVLHPLAGRPLLAYGLELARRLEPRRILAVIGHQADQVRAAFAHEGPEVTWVLQPEQKGTADAVACALPFLDAPEGTVLIHYGDVPLLRKESLAELLSEHRTQGSRLTFLTARLENPKGYGRMVRDGSGRLLRIVEEADATDEERNLREINTGITCVEVPFLLEALDRLDANNAKGELYLTDIAAYGVSRGLRIGSVCTPEPFRALGINTRKDLAEADRILRLEICERWMLEGVSIVEPLQTYIDASVAIGADTRIEPGCHLKGSTRVGNDCLIEAGSVIADSVIGDGVQVRPYSVIRESRIGDQVLVGPMAHLRPGTVLESGVRVGNFVEIKTTRVGERSKAAHLSYLGDCDIGKDVNVGCGTITCNYDGRAKHRTVIEDEAFIGSDTQLVAPVTVGRGAYIGSGSTITRDVPRDALAVSRARQKVVEGWALTRKTVKNKPGPEG